MVCLQYRISFYIRKKGDGLGCPSLDKNVLRTSRKQYLESKEAIVSLGIWSWAMLVGS